MGSTTIAPLLPYNVDVPLSILQSVAICSTRSIGKLTGSQSDCSRDDYLVRLVLRRRQTGLESIAGRKALPETVNRPHRDTEEAHEDSHMPPHTREGLCA